LKMQNYMDIDKISIRKYNFRRNEASPAPFRGGGARGWVPIKGRRIFRFFRVKERKVLAKASTFTPSKRSAEAPPA